MIGGVYTDGPPPRVVWEKPRYRSASLWRRQFGVRLMRAAPTAYLGGPVKRVLGVAVLVGNRQHILTWKTTRS